MTSHPIVEFGYAVRSARLDLEMSLTDAAVEILGKGDRKGYVSQIEKGTRNLSPETIDKFTKYLGLDANVVKAAHLASPLPKVEAKTKSGKKAAERKPEDQVDFDAERLLSKARRDEDSPQMGETLMIALAYEFAGGQYRDLHTAYSALRGALEAAGRLRAHGELRGNNAASHLDLVLADVAKLNEELRFEEADALFDVEEKRMRDAHQATEERQAEEVRQLLERRLDQDKVRDDPESAAKRLIADLHREAPSGGVFWATDQLSYDWAERGGNTGDMFKLSVALELAKANYNKAKGKRGKEATSLYSLGLRHLRIAERSSNKKHLGIARTAFEEALMKVNKVKDPEFWSGNMNALGGVILALAERVPDISALERSVAVRRAALSVSVQVSDKTEQKFILNNLGISLSKLGEVKKRPQRLEGGDRNSSKNSFIS